MLSLSSLLSCQHIVRIFHRKPTLINNHHVLVIKHIKEFTFHYFLLESIRFSCNSFTIGLIVVCSAINIIIPPLLLFFIIVLSCSYWLYLFYFIFLLILPSYRKIILFPLCRPCQIGEQGRG